MKCFWLSFVDNERPVGEKFLGALIIYGRNLQHAVERAWSLGLNPAPSTAS